MSAAWAVGGCSFDSKRSGGRPSPRRGWLSWAVVTLDDPRCQLVQDTKGRVWRLQGASPNVQVRPLSCRLLLIRTIELVAEG